MALDDSVSSETPLLARPAHTMGSFNMFRRTPSESAPAFERSSEEKALVRRLDTFFLTFGCLSQIIKYLDQQNINNAYVSGMQEDLHLYGDELNL